MAKDSATFWSQLFDWIKAWFAPEQAPQPPVVPTPEPVPPVLEPMPEPTPTPTPTPKPDVMSAAEQDAFFKALGIPYGTAAKRKASTAIFQFASTWGTFGSAACKKVGDLSVDGDFGVKTTVHARYAITKDYRIAPHFHLSEFACGCDGKRTGCRVAVIDRDLVVIDEGIRKDLYPTGLTIISAYRCPGNNKAVGGQPDSAHLEGRANDIPQRHPASEFKGRGLHGIEVRYATKKVSHVDIQRGLKADTVFYR